MPLDLHRLASLLVSVSCLLVPPSPMPPPTGRLPHAYLSPVPTVNQTLLPALPPLQHSAGASAKPTVPTAPPISDSPKRLPATEVIEIIRVVFGSDAPMALAIARAESGLDCLAQSKTQDSGVFQIHMPVQAWRFQGHSPYDCYANVLVAHQLYQEQGWTPWSVFRSGAYRRYL